MGTNILTPHQYSSGISPHFMSGGDVLVGDMSCRLVCPGYLATSTTFNWSHTFAPLVIKSRIVRQKLTQGQSPPQKPPNEQRLKIGLGPGFIPAVLGSPFITAQLQKEVKRPSLPCSGLDLGQTLFDIKGRRHTGPSFPGNLCF